MVLTKKEAKQVSDSLKTTLRDDLGQNVRFHLRWWVRHRNCLSSLASNERQPVTWPLHVTNPIIPSLCIQSDQRNSLSLAAMTAMISWCLRISVLPPALTMSPLVQESRILPGNRLGFHTHKKVTRGTRKRLGEEECWGVHSPMCQSWGGGHIMADGGMLFLHYQEICTLGVFCARLRI